CRSGNRAGKAVNTLKSLGYTNVTNIGGLDDARALQVQ
ncbi:MAG: rhodanese-related sulfurtransferase, partial [Bermanella sp.]